MALPFYALEQIKNLIPLKSGKICTISYHDIIASPEQIGKFYSIPVKDLPIRTDSVDIINWHKAWHITDKIVDTKGLFELLGFEFEAVDIVQARGIEQYCDLNYPLEEKFKQKYDLIIENCIEHCFNVGQAFMNTAEMVKEGGYIYHLNPCVMVNHSFWNISPTLYADFYSVNGFEIKWYELFEGIMEIRKVIPLHSLHQRIRPPFEFDILQVCIAKRIEIKKFVYPTQYKFQLYPESKK